MIMMGLWFKFSTHLYGRAQLTYYECFQALTEGVLWAYIF